MRLIKIVFTLFCCSLLTLQSFANIHSDKPIAFEDLPICAQNFILEYFSHMTVTRASYNTQADNRNYEVNLSDNTTLKFDEIGHWTTIESQDSSIPTTMIPDEIMTQVRTKDSAGNIRKIEKSEEAYHVTLLDRNEMLFNLDFTPIEDF